MWSRSCRMNVYRRKIDLAKTVDFHVGTEQQVQAAQQLLVLAARRRRHQQIPVDDLVAEAIVGHLLEVFVGERAV